MCPIPEQVLGVHVVIDNFAGVCRVQQVEQIIENDQRFEFGQPFTARCQIEDVILDGHAFGQVNRNILMRLPTHPECAAVPEFRQYRVPGQAFERALLVENAHLLPGAHRRRVLRCGTLNHNRAIRVERIVSVKRFAGASARVNVIVAKAIVEQTVRPSPGNGTWHESNLLKSYPERHDCTHGCAI